MKYSLPAWIYLMLKSVVLGSSIGLIVWLFLTVLNLTIHFIWDTVPGYVGGSEWTLILCTIGGILVGLCQKYFGSYPKTMHETLAELKETKRVEYRGLHKSMISSLIPLAFGGSLGPEAALVGMTGGMATWVSEKLKLSEKEEALFAEAAIGTTLGVTFFSPLFGLFAPVENEGKDAREVFTIRSQFTIYLSTIISGTLVFYFLSKIDNRLGLIVDFDKANLSIDELLMLVPLILTGFACGYFFQMSGVLISKFVAPIKHFKLLLASFGGMAIGIVGILLPYTLFSGEHQLRELNEEWHMVAPLILFITGLAKLFITQFCINTGWRGGNIFPLFFSSASIGYALSMWLSIDPIFSVCVVASAIICYVIKKPIAVVLFLALYFPLNLVIFMLIATLIINNLNIRPKAETDVYKN